MKATVESYWKDTVTGPHDTLTGVILRNLFSDFPSSSHAKYYPTKRKIALKKMLRIHDSNLFLSDIRRSLHHIFGSAVSSLRN